MSSTAAQRGNQLIDRLPVTAARSLLAACHTVQLPFNLVLAQAGDPIVRVLFPTTAILSLTTSIGEHKMLGMAMIGFEGLLGTTLAQGVCRHPMQAIVQGAGEALEITASDFQHQLVDNPVLKDLINGYGFVLVEQLVLTATCNAFHDVTTRLARWLLMMDDRAGGNDLMLTHQFLSNMLGVRRSAITIAAGHLQKQQVIHYTRGRIQVLSRAGLESVACECYPAAIAAYQRQFKPG